MWGLVDQIREYEDKLKRLRGLQRLECCMDSPCGDSGCCSYAVMEPASDGSYVRWADVEAIINETSNHD
jgi:hypothetical protein